MYSKVLGHMQIAYWYMYHQKQNIELKNLNKHFKLPYMQACWVHRVTQPTTIMYSHSSPKTV